jgi:hypothetical protein
LLLESCPQLNLDPPVSVPNDHMHCPVAVTWSVSSIDDSRIGKFIAQQTQHRDLHCNTRDNKSAASDILDLTQANALATELVHHRAC